MEEDGGGGCGLVVSLRPSSVKSQPASAVALWGVRYARFEKCYSWLTIYEVQPGQVIDRIRKHIVEEETPQFHSRRQRYVGGVSDEAPVPFWGGGIPVQHKQYKYMHIVALHLDRHRGLKQGSRDQIRCDCRVTDPGPDMAL